jgi:predicted transcriptional regulator
MNRSPDIECANKMATDIVVAYLEKHVLEPEQLPRLVLSVRQALTSDLPSSYDDGQTVRFLPFPQASGATPVEATIEAPAASPATQTVAAAPSLVDQSITDDYLVCLEDGGRFRSLKRHLMTKHNLTPEQYRAKWNLPRDYPMVARTLAEHRSDVAVRSKLGRPRTAAKQVAERTARASTKRRKV